jgi:hypothetical protein
MNNIIAIEIKLNTGAKRYFLTWGRIQDNIDPTKIEKTILRYSKNFDLGGRPTKAKLCPNLQKAKNEPYFYECFFEMCQEIIPFGKNTYEQWRKEMNSKMQVGKEIYYLGKNLS